jgi:polysaccharide biosynthesis transport protein
MSSDLARDQGALASQNGVSFFELYATFYRSRFWIIAILVGMQLLAIAYSLLATRYYESEATVEVRQEAEKVLGTEADRESSSTKLDTDRFLQTQLDIVRSRATANAVAEALRLYRGDTFLEAMKAEDTIRNNGILSVAEAKREAVIKALRDNLSVGFTGETRLAAITFSSPDPRLSAQIANSYTESFIRSNLSRKLDSSSYALQFLRDQLRDAQSRLEQSELDAVNYARQTRIVDASNAASNGGRDLQPQSLITAQLVQLNEELGEATGERIALEQKWKRTARLPVMSIPEVLTNQAVQGILQRRADAEAAYREQLSTRQEDHPTVREARAGVVELDNQIATVARDIRQSIRNEYVVARAKESELNTTLDGLKNRTLSEQNMGIQLSILRREADTNRTQYQSLLRRYNELNAEAGVQTNNLSIVDRAQVAIKPAWPKLPLNIALAGLFGVLLSAGLVVVRAQLFDAVRVPDDVIHRLKLPLLGTVPDVENVIIELANPKSATSEATSSIRTNLLLSSDHGAPRTLMVTSAQAGEGKSSTAHAIAWSFARLDKRVLIIDLDLRRPNAHKLFDMENRAGISSVLAGQVEAQSVIRKTSIDKVDLITVGDHPPDPTDLISAPSLTKVLDQLAADYDLIIVDAPPVLGLADAVVLASRVEAVVFVVEAGRNTVRGIFTATDRLRQGNSHIVGAVLTKFNAAQFGYGSSAYYGYSYDYSQRDPN